LVWGALVMLMYGVSYSAFSDINAGIVAVKLGQRTLLQISRVTYVMGEAALSQVRTSCTDGERIAQTRTAYC
jgi:hypothetical protein